MSEQELKALRVRIDSLDEKILELISDRARCAEEVARVKTASLKEGEKPVFYRPEREAAVLKRVMERNKGPLGNEEMARLFREIMSSCLALEEPLKIAYLGPEGTFTQAAAMACAASCVLPAIAVSTFRTASLSRAAMPCTASTSVPLSASSNASRRPVTSGAR